MEKAGKRKMGAIACAIGLLLLALNIVDYLAGWNAFADETAVIGVLLAAGGALLALMNY